MGAIVYVFVTEDRMQIFIILGQPEQMCERCPGHNLLFLSFYLSLQMSDTVSILSLLYILIILPIIPLYRTLNTDKQEERGPHVEQGDEEEQKSLM